jgi:hypothetical protein
MDLAISMVNQKSKYRRDKMEINVSGMVETPMPPTAMGSGSFFITDQGDDERG